MSQSREGTALISPTNVLSDTGPRPNGMTDEQVRHLTAILGSGKQDSAALDRIFDDAAEVRRQLNAEFLRLMDADDKK